jgi:hypothetical protein
MQMSLPILDLSKAVEQMAKGNKGERGAIFTRREIVDFILDLAGYTTNLPLTDFRVLEPSFGYGDFLIPIAERLLSTYAGHNPQETLAPAIRAVEIHHDSTVATRAKLMDLLADFGISHPDATRILEAWIIEGDFLLTELDGRFTHTIGNPPYVRQEMIPEQLLTEYRLRYSTIYDRADLYIPFIEKCLRHLSPGGSLAFICADRWMKNKYGGPLRKLISTNFNLACYIDMTDTPAFHSNVSAYPAITLIKSEKPGITRIASRLRVEKESLSRLATEMRTGITAGQKNTYEIQGVVHQSDPWILKSLPQLAVVRKLEENFPSIEEAGCRVGIGVATGADRIYTGKFQSLNVESDRKLPLIKTADIKTGEINWHGQGLINPFNDDGSLVDLNNYPKLSAHLSTHEEAIRRRNCARRNPNNWYRTIDRITPSLATTPKLLIPDIKGDANVVLDEGHYYPHHNLYYITSTEWDLSVLKKVLESGIARLFVSLYSTQMRGGFLRFQAQYLRRIHIPKWRNVPDQIKNILSNDPAPEIFTQAVYDLYKLTDAERRAIINQP